MKFDTQNAIIGVLELAYFDAAQDEACGEPEICEQKRQMISQVENLIMASSDMLYALELCEDVLSELARIDDGTPSISALILSREAIARAKG